MIADLAHKWMIAKANEAAAIDERRSIEDALKAQLKIAEDLEGTQTKKEGDYIIKVVGRIDRKVDGDKLQELAVEAGLTEHLSSLFRWKPEISMTAWKAATADITKPLLGAITSKPGRPSFQITKSILTEKE